MNNLMFIGLLFNFIGTFILIIEVLVKSESGYDNNMRSALYNKGKVKWLKFDKTKDGSVKQVKITKSEIIVIFGLILICLGFIFQLISNLI